MRSKPRYAILTLHDSLTDFIGTDSGEQVRVDFNLHPSVKDLFESRGIPHTEVFGVEINGEPVSFDRQVEDGAEIDLYPVEGADEIHFKKLSKFPGEQPRTFVADVHLGKLARLLRLLGIDTRYANDYGDHELIRLAAEAGRTLLTRDLDLLKHGSLKFGYWVRTTDPEKQVVEIVERFDLAKGIHPFSRCLECNGFLESVSLQEVEKQVPPKVKEWCDSYYRCQSCGKAYWRGSHYADLEKQVRRILDRI